MTDRSTSRDWLPERIGKYKILGILGMGGMGVIYRAEQEMINRIVALKVLSPQYSQDKESSIRFETEAKAVSMLQHQNIVQLYEYGEEGGSRYFTMQFIDGDSLASRIEQKKFMPVEKIIDYAKQICRGLRYAHGMNVIHRDIKPGNVLIDKSEVVRVTDFGIAKVVSQHSITLTGITVGTPEYMSPEQAEGIDLTGSTDIYSLGIVIYEMLTRSPPFLANNPVAVAYKQVHELPVPPSVKRPDCPKRLELIVLKCLKKDPRERYQHVDDLLRDLDTVDIDERAERPTVTLKTTAKREAAKDKDSERRITDRRNGERRHDTLAGLPIGDPAYWQRLLYYGWPALILGAAALGLMVYHLANHP
jgi:eukaryotic-like serine/threonine-protein kinase